MPEASVVGVVEVVVDLSVSPNLLKFLVLVEVVEVVGVYVIGDKEKHR
jgi:hypothetical protein